MVVTNSPGRGSARDNFAGLHFIDDLFNHNEEHINMTLAKKRPAFVQSPRPMALITGASSGIGEALSWCFARDGYDVVLVARNPAKLHVLADDIAKECPIDAVVEPADLAKTGEAQRLAAALRLRRKKQGVDVVVNNAGVLYQGEFLQVTALEHQQMIALNCAGLTAMIAAFVPAMVKRGHGRVLNVASIASFQPVPVISTYAATKAFVLSLTESLSEELKGSGVTMTALCPGVTDTNMLAGAQRSNARLSKIPSFMIGDVDDVARQGYNACLRGDVICVPGVVNRAAMLASRSAPKWLVRRLGGVLGRSAAA